MDNIIKNLEAKSLSDVDIHNVTDANVIVYSDLKKYSSLDDLMGDACAAVILFRTAENFGHWTCIFKHNSETVEWFDSLAFRPDDELKKTKGEQLRIQLGQNLPLLTKLIDESPYRCIYNHYKLQENARDVNTCGRWCILRLALREMGPKEFRNLFINQKFKPDYYASALTAFI